MKLAFVCDTPYQVLTAVNLYWTSFYAEKQTADLYIVDQFKDASKIYNNIVKEDLFDNVYLLNREENRFMPSGIKRYIKVAYSYLNPVHAINNQSKEIKPQSLKNRYDKIFSSVMTCFVSALIKLNKKAEFSLFDDGLGSYYGDIVYNGGGIAYRCFSKITKTGIYAKRAEKLYVNNKEMCQSKAADIFIQIPKMDDSFFEIANRVFSLKESISENKRIIFLSQPSTGLQTIENDMQRLVEILRVYKDNVTVRLHPREINYEKYKEFQLDTSGELWELKVSKMDMDDMILIAAHSTAQITPKVIFDKEPSLIFTYYLSTAYTDIEKKAFDDISNNLKNHYRDKRKIMIPKDENELKLLLKGLM